MISARGLRKAYREPGAGVVPVLDGLELEVAAGDFLAVVGRSGSGKSTLLQLLGALDQDFEGQLTVAGERLEGLAEPERARFRNRKVGFVFQAFHLVPGLSALENVALPGAFSAQAVAAPRERALEALEEVGLGGKADRLPAQLSGGERQRVAIARALFFRPPLLLCDEPTGNLDARTAEEVGALFSRLHQGGLTLVVVTHEDRLVRAARRRLTLEGGRLS